MQPDEAAELVRAFLNTRDVEAGTDALADPDALLGWLSAQPGMPVVPEVSDEELIRTRAVRDTLRWAVGDPDSTPDPDAVAAVALRLVLTDGEPRLTAGSTGVSGLLGQVLAAVAVAHVGNTWERLKICGADTCRWAFYDRSKNRSGRWCSMAVCGNRTKKRAYRERAAAT